MHPERAAKPLDANVYAGVVEKLRGNAARGVIEPGQRIREVEIAAQFGMSRTN